MEQIISQIDYMIREAEEVYRSNTKAGSPVQSTAYDAGRISGLKEALDIVVSMSNG